METEAQLGHVAFASYVQGLISTGYERRKVTGLPRKKTDPILKYLSDEITTGNL